MSDMWESADSTREAAGADLGTAAYGQGLFVNQVFSVDNVFRAGVAALQEQPALVLLTGLNLLVMQFLPQFAGYPVQGFFMALESSGSLDPDVAQMLASVSSMFVGLAFMPVQQVVMAGGMVGCALWVRNGEVSIGALYTSFAAGLRVLLYSLLAGIVGLLVAVVCLGPAIGVVAAVVAFDGGLALSLAAGGFLAVLGMIAMAYVSLGLLLGPYAAAIDGLGPVAAMQASWQAADGARFTLLVTTFLFGLLGSIACCMFGVPYIVVAGINVAGFTAAWLLHARSEEETKEWGFVQRNLKGVHG